MRADTTPKMIAESLMVDYADKYGSTILESLKTTQLRAGEPTFTLTLKNGKTYRVTVAEE